MLAGSDVMSFVMNRIVLAMESIAKMTQMPSNETQLIIIKPSVSLHIFDLPLQSDVDRLNGMGVSDNVNESFQYYKQSDSYSEFTSVIIISTEAFQQATAKLTSSFIYYGY